MFPAQYFDNEEIRKYTLLFGELFSNIRIERTDGVTADTQYQIVPIAYGGREKYAARNEQDPNADKSIAVQYPRMSFEFVGMQYDPSRQLNPILKNVYHKADGSYASRFMPVPWVFGFNLYITGRSVQDLSKVVQQIIPYFTPSYNVKAEVIDDSCAQDLQVVLHSADLEDNYQGPMDGRRIQIWTLSFSLKGWFFGLEKPPGALIRWVRTDIKGDMTANSSVSVSNTYPTVAGKQLNEIQPSDLYTVTIDITEFDGAPTLHVHITDHYIGPMTLAGKTGAVTASAIVFAPTGHSNLTGNA